MFYVSDESSAGSAPVDQGFRAPAPCVTPATDRASLRLARACSRASASETSVVAPSPSSRRRPRMTSRWIQLRVLAGCTKRYSLNYMQECGRLWNTGEC